MPGVEPLRSEDPDEIGGYQLAGRLGEGGQGVVYLANTRTGRVAIKVPHSRLAGDDPDAYQRFLSEITAVRRVAHFCTARVLHVGIDDEYPYIVSEYVEGVSLQTTVEVDGPLSGGALDRLAAGTMMALAATHAANVIHQDFTPHNVLLGPDGPRVIDFGVARALETPRTVPSGPLGTPAYMAPEQVRRDEVGPAADMFSWAITMTYAATGRPAFGEDSAVSDRILHAEPDVADLPSPLREMVGRCLVKDPRQRPRARDVLLRLLGYDDVALSQETPGEVLTRTPRTPTIDRRLPEPSGPAPEIRSDPPSARPGTWWRSGRVVIAFGVVVVAVGALFAVPRFLREQTAEPAARSGAPAAAAARRTVTVGSANFAGNQLLGEIYAQALEAKRYRVTRKPNIGNREAYYNEIKTGAISVIPEYNGALATWVDKSGDATSSEEINALLRRRLPPQLEILDSAEAEDKDSITVTQRTATRHGLKSINDLKEVAEDLVIGGPSEFETRHQGLVGLRIKYGLHFKEFQPFDTSDQDTMISLLKRDLIQVANLFTTNAAIATNKFVVLEDPENVFVAENVTPLAYKPALDDGARAQLNAVSAKLTTADLLAMMKRLQVDGRSPDVVAKDWLQKGGLVG